MTQSQECKRCGTCCKKGGPSLHREDKDLLKDGPVRYDHLVSIRKGEAVISPMDEDPEPTAQELVKIAGKGKEWECIFFNQEDCSCSIYDNRPLECRLLKCWDTSELEEVAGNNILTRIDILPPEHPVLEFIHKHERQCPIPEQELFITAASPRPESAEALAELTELVRRDLDIRVDAVNRFDLSLPLELFLFGRPVHKLLAPYGLTAIEDSGNIVIHARARV